MKDLIKDASRLLRGSAPLAALLLSGCLLNPGVFRKGAFSTDEWETWTSWNDDYGSHSVSGYALNYKLSADQNDTRDMPIDGLLPGLLLSRSLPGGSSWLAEVSASFSMPPGNPKRFSFGVWIGEEHARPSLESPAARLKLLVQRLADAPDGTGRLEVSAPPLSGRAAIPAHAKTFRFRKEGNNFFIFYATDGKDFRQALAVTSQAAAGAPAAKLVVGGRAEGDPEGAKARFYNLRINGR